MVSESTQERNPAFAPGEVGQIVIAWVVLSMALSITDVEGLFVGTGSLDNIAAAFIATATGFILHEMGHKFVAMRRGYIAHFRIWIWGIALALITAVASQGQFIFGAPGAVYIAPATGVLYYGAYASARQRSGERDNAVISAAGPGTNLAFALFFLFLIFILPTSGFWSTVATFGFILNLGLGSFNMLPIPPMDGYKIFKGSIPLGLLIALPLWAMFVFLVILP
jgi:Zn-dependent protease